MGNTHQIVNTVLICTLIVVSIYIMVNMNNNLNIFKGLYNEEQDDKHAKLGNIFNVLSKNDSQLKNKTDEHNTRLDSHKDKLIKHKGRLDAHKGRLERHNDSINRNESRLNSHSELLRNHNNRSVFASIEENTTLINDKFSRMAALVVGNPDNPQGNNTNINMATNDEIKINIGNPKNLKVCYDDPNNQGQTICSRLVTRNWVVNNSVNSGINSLINSNGNVQTPDQDEHFTDGITTNTEASVPELAIYLNPDTNRWNTCVTGTQEGTNICKTNQTLYTQKGEKGERGPTGYTSFNDLTPEQKESLQGAIGPVGPQGEIGPQGPKGDTGAQGPSGPQGNTGNAGVTGPRGPRGPRGFRGSRGPAGPRGNSGIQHRRGRRGRRGFRGRRR